MYFPNTHAVIYVVDSSDKARLNKAAEELNKVVEVFLFKILEINTEICTIVGVRE